MEDARTVITQLAKLSIDRSIEFPADVPSLVYKKKNLKYKTETTDPT